MRRRAPALRVFLLLLPVRLLSALLSAPSDCDETFNYWEPLHYLLFASGLQTWEYSPVFALRSYSFLFPYAAPAILATYLSPHLPVLHALASPKIAAFYVVRASQATVCAAAEAALHAAARTAFGHHVAAPFLIFLASSPGIFRSAVEFLPSSFAQICLTASFAFWLTPNFPPAIFLVALASLLGWVFAAALAVPMALHILFSKGGVPVFCKWTAISAAAILAVMVPVDSYYFGKLVVAPLNHVLYNVFPKDGAGSHLFGVEGVSFYVANLILNCNVAAVLFAIFPFVFVIGSLIGLYPRDGTERWKRLIFLSPSYIYLAILTSQPHKEERFLAPCYTFIALTAAVALADSIALFLRLTRPLGSSFARVVKTIMSLALLLLCITLGASRIIMQIKSYRAPLDIYRHLSDVELQRGIGPRDAPSEYMSTLREINICVGKEWYRFPASFFLPDRRFRIRFVRSGFTGLMPKPFREDGNGTRVIPSGMNEFNKEDPAQFYAWSQAEGCHYFVDLDLSHRQSQDKELTNEESPIPKEARAILFSATFLDSELSRAGFRAFFLPGFEDKLVYGQYQLIRNLDLLPIVR